MVNATPHHSYHKGYGVTAVTSGHGTKGMSDGGIHVITKSISSYSEPVTGF